jgi:hypothetical protein
MRQGQAQRRYTIAWICPLAVEYAAAVHMLDKIHGCPSYLTAGSNAYTLGSIHGHNVVVMMPRQSQKGSLALLLQPGLRIETHVYYLNHSQP